MNDQAIIAILRGLQGPSKTDPNYVPEPTSSILIEFYNTSNVANTFNRANYYVKIYLDDVPLYIDNVCTPQSCKWDVLANYLTNRTYVNGTYTLI